jgi:membrane associated rhomboid family serine protease
MDQLRMNRDSCNGGNVSGLSLRGSFLAALAFLGLLWLVKTVESLAGVSFVALGVYPNRFEGLLGLLFAPLVHGSWTHLLSNTAPILILGTTLLYGYPRAARIVFPAVYVGAGLAVWLFARPAFHIGASGLSFGALAFVFTIGVLRWDPKAIALALIVSFLYGATIWGVLPYDPNVSYETHFFGALIGFTLAFVLRRMDPPPPRRRYDWESEDDESRADPFPSRARTLH